ncbi:thiol-disulfide oxidoreductase ResA [mine drainage metagenome]|uniref:Thiol-disulfide oxidoreductase ResA n=1 Tax=mine drainage metagenome TaxID=410659 RepID=A0A1J5RXT6_9ZZZZ
MLKRTLARVAYFATMIALGFAIYYYFLGSAHLQNKADNDYKNLSTQALFAATLPNENGINQAISQYKGKIIILNFWATWCSPCREEMPELSALHTEYRSKNVIVLGIAIDEPNAVKTFTQSTPVSYPVVISENEGMELAGSLGNSKDILPYTVIINTEGTVVKTHFGRINKPLIEATLNTLLNH